MDIEKINRTKAYADKMRQEGKVITYNKPEDIEVSIQLNKRLEQFRREYQHKDRSSQMSAYKVVLTKGESAIISRTYPV